MDVCKFDPPKLKCLNCEEIVFSKWPGDWVACKCFRNEEKNTGIYVDSTRYYTRIGGAKYSVIYAGSTDDDEEIIL